MSESACSKCENESCSAKSKKHTETDAEFMDRQKLKLSMCKVKHKVLVLSGKGGVGKSTVAVNLAMSLALNGKKVGLVDVDIHGPSIPKLLNLENVKILSDDQYMYPADYNENLKVISVGLFLESQDDALIWRGPRKFGLIKQFLQDVNWGELDFLLFDLPPGTGDEPLAICELIEDPDGAVVVTTPQGVAITDVRKSINFCKKLNLPVLGVVENMSGFICPKCGELTNIFSKDGAKSMCDDMDVPFLGNVPIDAEVVTNGDKGTPFVCSESCSAAAEAFNKIVEPILNLK